ncbi:discoidin domain-containing protein [Asanoa sp. WMMD1127]|uniref:discoidin domain-containing protein n=1 Tax=Asanoa sp. WMMD1127 TaxID=3016107 RepID=UPI002417F6F5|nr:discoidin domain-containing protein [Asanoa sp. WMMD1127]MDG4826988.1 discoidin domain-containing protein [Asanoa sp. WMMD1127]
MRTRPSRRVIAGTVVAAVVAGVGLATPAPAQAATPTPDQQWAAIQSLLANIKGRWTDQSYVNSVVNGMPSTALLGNGDIGVTSSGSAGVKTFLVAKGNFWRGNPGPATAPVGGVTLAAASGSTSSNLALGATATASTSHPSFPQSRAVSGQWGPGYEGWVSEVGKPQTLTLDLGSAKTFTRYIARHDSAARPAETANNTKNFQVLTSTDNQNWSSWDTVTNNTAAVTDRTLGSRTARWVRLVSTEPTQGTTADSQQNPRARIGQFELYGTGGGPGGGSGGTFLEEQNILRGEVDTTMTIGGQPVVLKTWVAANDNLLVTQIRSTGSAPVRLEARTWSGATNPMGGFTQTAGASGNTTWAARTTPGGSRWVSRAALASRLIGASPVAAPTASGNTARFQFDLQPGQTLRLLTAVAGGGANNADPAPGARSLADAQTGTALDGLYNGHVEWWKQFWLRSYVDLNDDVLERFYYAAQYFLGSASRNGRTAPGLYGLWTTKDDPYFSGDYHLNYNFVANFYGAYSSNRADLALPMIDAVISYLPEARRRSTQELQQVKSDYVTPRFGSGGIPGGVLFPVGISPFGGTPDGNYWQQVGNALFNVVEFIAYWDYTRDRTYLQTKAYPFMKEVATFFSRWMEYDAATGRYTTWGGPHEGTWARNPSLDVGMLRYLLTSLLAASNELGLDAGSRPLWQQMLNGLPPIATTTHNGKSVYALGDPGTVSDGRAIRPGDNTVNLEFIHPGEGLGLNSPAADRQRAIDTLDAMNSWGQDNSFPKVFTQAARVGYPAQSLIDKLKAQIAAKTDPNLRIRDEWHGLEKSGATEAVNNLLLQSDDGIIRVFPVWPAARDASFVKLREKDAFLVSSALAGGRVSYVDITSEAGRQVRLRNPWPGRPVVVTRVGGGAVTPSVTGDVVSFATQAGATYTITSP